ncbi:MAG: hypothetical protein J6S49_08870 [Erysipelotrichaceae bacterium]|nr:hypothetical protein [Erysipelotrichaceae bacterium]MBP5279333.1 hypothetical protein [Erysipelotrichaceae bacterium]
MAEIDLEIIKDIDTMMEGLEKDDVLFVKEEGKDKYVILHAWYYELLEDVADMFQAPPVSITRPDDIELSYDEYERIKNQIMELVEKTLMPKPEKLN